MSDDDERKGVRIFRRIYLHKLIVPILNLVKGLTVGDVIDQDTAGRAAIIRRAESVEFFTSGCVPYLQADMDNISVISSVDKK